MTTTATPYHYVALTDPTVKRWHLGATELGTTAFCGVRLLEPTDAHALALKVPVADRHHETSPDLELVTCGLCKRNREWLYATGTPRPEGKAPAVPKARVASGTTTPAPAPRRRNRNAAATGEGTGDVTASTTGGLTAAEARQMAEAAADRNGGGNTTPSHERAVLDARVFALLRTYAPGTRHPIADVRGAMDPAPTMAKLKASLGRLVKAEMVTLEAGGYEVAGPTPDDTLARIEAAVAEVTGEPAPGAGAPGSGVSDARAAEALTDAVAGRVRKQRPLSRAAKARALVEAGECANLADARRYLADMGE